MAGELRAAATTAPRGAALQARSSEGDHGRFRVAQRLEVFAARVLHHGRGTAHQDQRVQRSAPRRRDVLSDHRRRDKALFMLPLLRRGVERVDHVQLALALVNERLQPIPQQDVVLGLVGVYQSEPAMVARVAQSCRQYSHHRRDACAACQHRDVLHCHRSPRQHESAPAEVLMDAQRTVYLDFIAWALAVQVEADLPAVVPRDICSVWHPHLAWTIHLDNQVEVSTGFILRDGSVWPIDVFRALVEIRAAVPFPAGDARARVRRGHHQVLPDRQTQNGALVAKRNAESFGVVRDLDDVKNLHPLLLPREQRLRRPGQAINQSQHCEREGCSGPHEPQ
mmetsp:Transcript_19414/g.53307  ORF Transcript_19414/g.53307 Transcript_19414/m.53307 type:complete len:338 (-) Transcript_19414:108-1121(-)